MSLHACVYVSVHFLVCLCVCTDMHTCMSVRVSMYMCGMCVFVCVCVCMLCVCVDFKNNGESGVVTHAFNPSTREAEAGRFLS
jgi:F0F1-type ATP synthase assembly protein I